MSDDRRFDRNFPRNAEGFHQPQPTTDRFPNRDGVYSVPPQRNNAGADGMGAPPRRDRRRSRAQGQNIAARLVHGTFDEARPTISAQLASWDTGPDEGGEEASTIIAQFKAYDFAENAVTALGTSVIANPFAGVACTLLPAGVLQSLEVVCNLQWGHDGVSQKTLVNMPAGQIVRGSTAGSYCRANAKLTPRYFERFAGPNTVSGASTFFYLDPNPNQANNFFNSIDSPALVPQVSFDRDTVPVTPIHIEGIISNGYPAIGQGGSSDRSSRLTRRFFGTFPTEAAGYPAGGALVFCPIAFGASAVMLQALPTGFADFSSAGGPVLSPLLMGQVDGAGNLIVAQLVPNFFFPLDADCKQVFVYNTAVNGAENPFSLIYDLGL